MSIPELHQRRAALYAELATIERELATAYAQEANALANALQITTSEAGLVAAHDVAALRTEILAMIADLRTSREIWGASITETLLAFDAKLDHLIASRA